MRHTGWMRWRGDKTGLGKYESAARKLLGALGQRLKLGGIETGTNRRTLDDGAVVEVAWIKGQPVVRVMPPPLQGGESPIIPACEMYVESGLLDLGANIAADAGERFNRGAPVFDDSPATLHFGDAVTCVDNLSGKVQVAKRGEQIGMRSACLGEAGDAPIESRLMDPAKKQAQAMMPASCWTGLMQRYVAAIYGGSDTDYRAGGDGVQIMSSGEVVQTITPWMSNSWGLVLIGKRLLFVRIVGNEVSFHAAHFGTCGSYVFAFWKTMRRDTPLLSAKADKVLSVALSDCSPSKQPIHQVAIGLVDDDPVGSYGWAFHPSIPRACAVLCGISTSTLYEIEFSIGDGGDPVATLSALANAKMPPASIAPKPEVVPCKDGVQRKLLAPSSDLINFTDLEYDTLVDAWYDDDGSMVVTKFFASITDSAPFDDLSYQCLSNGTLSTWPYVVDALTGIDCFAQFTRSTVRGIATTRTRAATFASGFYNDAVSAIASRKTMMSQTSGVLAPSFPAQSSPSLQCRYDVTSRVGPIQNDNADTYVWHDDGTVGGVLGMFTDSSDSIAGLFPGSAPDMPCVISYGASTGINFDNPPLTCSRYLYQWNEVRIDKATVEAGCPSDYPMALRWDNDIFDSTVCDGITYSQPYSHGWMGTLDANALIFDTPKQSACEVFGDRRKLAFASYEYSGFNNTSGVATGTSTWTVPGEITVTGEGWLVCRKTAAVDTKQACFSVSLVEDQAIYGGGSGSQLSLLPALAPAAYVPPISGIVGSYTRTAGDSGTIPLGNYGKERVDILLDDLTLSKEGYVFTATPSIGAFAWSQFPASYAASSCPSALTMFDHIGPAGVAYEAGDDINISAEYDDGSHRLLDRYVTDGGLDQPVFCAGFSYRAMRSLLGAAVLPDITAGIGSAFGASIEMDRETISGGYSKVSWPSFVGWA